MSKKADTYTVSQSAKVLEVSPKRVRQLIEEGQLTKHSIDPITISQREVIELRAKREQSGVLRRSQKVAEGSKSAQILANNDLIEKISTLVAEKTALALEVIAQSNQRNEANLIAQINELKAENERLKARKWWKK